MKLLERRLCLKAIRPEGPTKSDNSRALLSTNLRDLFELEHNALAKKPVEVVEVHKLLWSSDEDNPRSVRDRLSTGFYAVEFNRWAEISRKYELSFGGLSEQVIDTRSIPKYHLRGACIMQANGLVNHSSEDFSCLLEVGQEHIVTTIGWESLDPDRRVLVVRDILGNVLGSGTATTVIVTHTRWSRARLALAILYFDSYGRRRGLCHARPPRMWRDITRRLLLPYSLLAMGLIQVLRIVEATEGKLRRLTGIGAPNAMVLSPRRDILKCLVARELEILEFYVSKMIPSSLIVCLII